MNNIDPTTALVGAATAVGVYMVGKRLVSGAIYGAGFAVGCILVYNYKGQMLEYAQQNLPENVHIAVPDAVKTNFNTLKDFVSGYFKQ